MLASAGSHQKETYFRDAWLSHEHQGSCAPSRECERAHSGGLGLAAIQIAKAAGAGVLATAGSVLKRSYLREQDVPAVVSSRSLEFAEHFGRSKKSQPTIILNSLTSPGTPEMAQAMQSVVLVCLPDPCQMSG